MEDRLKLIHNLNTAINKVRNFSTPNFNNVFSRQYSEDIIFNMLNSKNTNYAFIFGDFNKLRTINELYGHEYGTKIMQIALNLIKKDLPQNSIMFRIGGDEFGFIIFDKTEKDCKQYIEKINNTLKDNASSISGISIKSKLLTPLSSSCNGRYIWPCSEACCNTYKIPLLILKSESTLIPTFTAISSAILKPMPEISSASL